MKKKIIVILFMIIILSCTRNNVSVKEFDEFEHKVNLIHTDIITPPVLFMVGGMVLLDSVLITVDLKSNTFLQAFKVPTFDYIGGYITKGNGPKEEIFIYPYMQPIDGNKFLYQCTGKIKIANFNLVKNEIEVEYNVKLPGKLINLNQAFKLENLYYGCDLHSKSTQEFVGYNPVNNNIFDFGHTYPKVETKTEGQIRTMLFAKAIAVKPDKSLFACVYDKFPILRIYSKDGTLKTETRYINDQDFPFALVERNPSKDMLDNIMQNYRKVKVTDRFIYALYIGKTQRELNKKGAGLDDFSNEIHVWDWKGNPIKKILLDENIFSFCVDPNDKYLICSSLNSIDKLYKYTLNGTKE